MGSDDSSGCGCLGFVAVVAGLIALVMVAMGHDPQQSALFGLKWGVGLWFGLVAALLVPAVLVRVWRDLWRSMTRKSRWEQLDDE